MSVDSLVGLVMEVVWRRDRRWISEWRGRLALVVMVVVGRRDGNRRCLVALSSSWRWFGGGMDEGTVNVDVVLPLS